MENTKQLLSRFRTMNLLIQLQASLGSVINDPALWGGLTIKADDTEVSLGAEDMQLLVDISKCVRRHTRLVIREVEALR